MGLDPYLEFLIRRGQSPRDQELETLNDLLNANPPHQFVPDDTSSELCGWGYWRIDAGVVSYHRDQQGKWEPNSVSYTEKEITRLHTLLQQPPMKFSN